MTSELPAVSDAGAAFQAAIIIGKFQGRTAPTTPIGSRMIMPSASGPVGAIESYSLSAASAYQRNALIDLGQVGLAAVGDRLAGLERIEQRQLLGVLLDQVGEAEHHRLALGGGAA